MRLALVTHAISFQDGQGRVNYEVAQNALEQGHDVTIIASSCAPEIANHPRAQFVPIAPRRVPTVLLHSLWFAYISGKYIHKHRGEYDLLQANGWVTTEPADVVATHFVHTAWLRNPYFPYHWSSLSPYAWYQRFTTLLMAHFERGAFRRARRLIAVSSATARELIGLGIPADKIRVVYNGVDVKEFHPGLSERALFNLPPEVPLALFVGDIKTTRKNLDTVLKALVHVPDLHLAVAGSTSESPYPAMAAELKLDDRVHFIGKTSQIPQLMRSTDFFVFPSRYEAHPLVLMEAMASGLPLIVSANFGAADYVHDAGIILDDPDDFAALASAMTTLSTSPAARTAIGEAARNQACSMQWSDTADGYLAVYRELLRTE